MKIIIDWIKSILSLREKEKIPAILQQPEPTEPIGKTGYALTKEINFWKKVAHRRMRRDMEYQTKLNQRRMK